MDSDRGSRYAKLGKTKERVEKEIQDGEEPGLAWVTTGRFIESYVPREELTRLLGTLYSDKTFIEYVDKYANALRLEDNNDRWTPDKVRVAKEVCAHWKSGLDYLDLYARIRALAELIEAANGLQDGIPDRPPKSEPSVEWD